MLSVLTALCGEAAESLTWTSNVYVPKLEGVPEITPPSESAKPGGKEVPATTIQ
jgi:hypothetical protein